MVNHDKQAMGCFTEKEFGCSFTYRLTDNPWALSQGLIHEIDVLHGTRYALVKKTIVKVAVDEDDSGLVVMEKWQIKQNKHFIY